MGAIRKCDAGFDEFLYIQANFSIASKKDGSSYETKIPIANN